MAHSHYEIDYFGSGQWLADVERRIRMANPEPITAPIGERITLAFGGTALIAYFAFLTLDVINGWGLGWVVLGWAALSLGAAASLLILFLLWRWVYRGTGKYQMQNRK